MMAGKSKLAQPSAQNPSFMNGVVKVAVSLAYTTSHKAREVTAKPEEVVRKRRAKNGR